MATVNGVKVEMVKLKVQFSAIYFIFVTLGLVSCQVLTPPYFNLAVEATASCGVGVPEPELFCKLTGANPDKEDVVGDFEVIEGQLCDNCDMTDPDKDHRPEVAVDGTNKWWQSPPLSRGLQYNEVNFTIHLQQEFHVAYVFIKMGPSPRPGVFALERSRDHGKTWKPWQFFADTPSDCDVFFGREGYSDHIASDDSVICTTEYSKVLPLEGGEIAVSLVNNRPSSHNFSYSRSLQEWTKATDIRLRLLRTKTLLGDLMALARQDPTVTRRYYYTIKDISIGGQCVCNGHASVCDADSVDATKLVCRCQHNTCGELCEICCPGFVQEPWRPTTIDAINACEPCQCHGHSKKCRYDPEVDRNRSSIDIHGRYEGGGVCIDCLHNTMGINCEQCKPGYFRPSNSTRECQRCKCDSTYSTGNCMDRTGQCQCKAEYTGAKCDRCSDGYYGYPRCLPCQCHINGAQDRVCDVERGQCPCKPNFDGIKCDQCAFDYYNFPECRYCNDCIHVLMDDIETIEHSISSMRQELGSVSVGILASQRLGKINQTVAELRPLVDNLTNQPNGSYQQTLLKEELNQVQTLGIEVTAKSNLILRNTEFVESDAADAKVQAENLYQDLVQMTLKKANEAVDFVKDILRAIQGSTGGSNVDELLRQAEGMLAEIKSRNFSSRDRTVKEKLGKTRALRKAKKLMDRASTQSNRTADISIFINDILNKLQDLQNSSRHSLNHSQTASEMNNRIRQLTHYVTDLESESSRLDGAIGQLQRSVDTLSEESTILRPLVDNATKHALKLKGENEVLDGLILDTRRSAEAALNASKVYQTIISAINGALNASLEAISVAEEVSGMYSNLTDQATESRRRSQDLQRQADAIAAVELE